MPNNTNFPSVNLLRLIASENDEGEDDISRHLPRLKILAI